MSLEKMLHEEGIQRSRTSEKYYCPTCNIFDESGYTNCLDCGTELVVADEKAEAIFLANNVSTADAAAENTFEDGLVISNECAACGKIVDDSETRCHHCGAMLTDGGESSPAPPSDVNRKAIEEKNATFLRQFTLFVFGIILLGCALSAVLFEILRAHGYIFGHPLRYHLSRYGWELLKEWSHLSYIS